MAFNSYMKFPDVYGRGRNRIGRREKWPKQSWEEGEIGGKSREEGEKKLNFREEGEIGSKSREGGEIGSESREKGDLPPCSTPPLYGSWKGELKLGTSLKCSYRHAIEK